MSLLLFAAWCDGVLDDSTTPEKQALPLIESNALLDRFAELLGGSTHVDIAVAWLGPGPAIERLVEYAPRMQVRIAVGLAGNATDPTTVRRLIATENVELRVAPPPAGGLFHPKFYRFAAPERAICWIGSANFTRGGFSSNVELMHELRDRNDTGGSWFERLWQSLDQDLEPAIADYEEHYTPPKPGGYKQGRKTEKHQLPSLLDVRTWNEFVSGLRVLDDYCHHHGFNWDVLGKTHSYLHTIEVGRNIVRRASWNDFPLHKRDILLGREEPWDLLGNLRGAGAVVGAFAPRGDPEIRALVHRQLHNVVNADESKVIEAAASAVAEIRKLPRFGPAVATRLLALARPDRLVSVNSKSAAGLGEFAGMRQDPVLLTDRYGKLLRALHDTEWFRASKPEEPRELEIWRFRVALVDAYVYIPIHEQANAQPTPRT